MFMKDWKIERGILSGKEAATRSCKTTVRVCDTVYGPLKKKEGNYVRRVT